MIHICDADFIKNENLEFYQLNAIITVKFQEQEYLTLTEKNGGLKPCWDHYLIIKLDKTQINQLGDYEISFDIHRKENVADKDIGIRELYMHEIICLKTGRKNMVFFIYKKVRSHIEI